MVGQRPEVNGYVPQLTQLIHRSRRASRVVRILPNDIPSCGPHLVLVQSGSRRHSGDEPLVVASASLKCDETDVAAAAVCNAVVAAEWLAERNLGADSGPGTGSQSGIRNCPGSRFEGLFWGSKLGRVLAPLWGSPCFLSASAWGRRRIACWARIQDQARGQYCSFRNKIVRGPRPTDSHPATPSRTATPRELNESQRVALCHTESHRGESPRVPTRHTESHRVAPSHTEWHCNESHRATPSRTAGRRRES